MVQGMTLPGLLADIGDVLSNVALKDMLAAYVALSRVGSADTLLILRTFFKAFVPTGAAAWTTLSHEAFTIEVY